jgi:hypothetical protein
MDVVMEHQAKDYLENQNPESEGFNKLADLIRHTADEYTMDSNIS